MPACLVVTSSSTTADAVVVGGGTIGAWCAVFLKAAGLEHVVLLEAGYSVVVVDDNQRVEGVVHLHDLWRTQMV